MKIAVINGSMRHGSTWHCSEAVVRALGKTGETEVAEFFLPGDMPHFCCGCFSCIYDGADKCPHYGSVRPIVDAIIASDLVILSSPVYGFDVSGQMKALLDHLCYMWMSHRPESAMFRKVGLAVSTAAGAGLRHTLKTMRYSLTYWGMKRVFTFGAPVAAKSWSEISGKKRAKIEKRARRLAARISKSAGDFKKLPNPLFRSLFFRIMAGMQRKNDWNKTDRDHWEANGWLDGGRPF